MIHRARSKDQDHVVASGWTWDSEFPVVICVSQQSILNVSCILEVVILRGAGVRPNNLVIEQQDLELPEPPVWWLMQPGNLIWNIRTVITPENSTRYRWKIFTGKWNECALIDSIAFESFVLKIQEREKAKIMIGTNCQGSVLPSNRSRLH